MTPSEDAAFFNVQWMGSKLWSANVALWQRTSKVGITYVVTVASAPHIEEFFRECIDLSVLSAVSIELQRYATADQVRTFASDLAAEFGAPWPAHAQGYVHDPATFSASISIRPQHRLPPFEAYAPSAAWSFIASPEVPTLGTFESTLLRTGAP
jgi:hypothetical protein